MSIDEYIIYIKENLPKISAPLSAYNRGDFVRFNWCFSNPPEVHEGYIEVIDENGGGICSYISPSFDINCGDVTYKHISIVDIICRLDTK